MYDHIFYKQVQISRSDIRPHIKWAVSPVILHMVTSIFLQGLCGYIWVNILTLSPQRATYKVPTQVSYALKSLLAVASHVRHNILSSKLDTLVYRTLQQQMCSMVRFVKCGIRDQVHQL